MQCVRLPVEVGPSPTTMGLPMRGRGVLKFLGVAIKRLSKSNGVDEKVVGVRVGNVAKNFGPGLLSNNVAITTGKDSVEVDPRLDFARKFSPIYHTSS